MKVSELLEKIGLKALNPVFDNEISGVYISDMVSDIVAGAKPGDLLVTVQMHKNLIATANLVDASAIIFVRDKEPQQDVIDLANRAEITLLKSDLDSWKLAVKLHDLGLK